MKYRVTEHMHQDIGETGVTMTLQGGWLMLRGPAILLGKFMVIALQNMTASRSINAGCVSERLFLRLL